MSLTFLTVCVGLFALNDNIQCIHCNGWGLYITSVIGTVAYLLMTVGQDRNTARKLKTIDDKLIFVCQIRTSIYKL